MKIYDCFMYNNEKIILDLRLNYLDKYVEKFILVESKYDHQGNLKENLFNSIFFNFLIVFNDGISSTSEIITKSSSDKSSIAFRI